MADTKIAYGLSAALTITLASMASSATLIAGQESDALSNEGANFYLNGLLGGMLTTGGTPAAGTIEVWVYGGVNDTPDYPDVLTGADGFRTFVDLGSKRSSLYRVTQISVSTAPNRTYWFGPVPIIGAINGGTGQPLLALPKNWGVFVSQNTGDALNGTPANHAIWHTPLYETTT